MSEVEDVALLDRSRRGDEEAFSRLFGRYQRTIHRYAVYMGGREAADDIVQETFLAVLRQTGRHDALRGSVVGYLIGIARHVVMKRLAARKEMSLDEVGDDSLGEASATDQPTALEDLARTETIKAVRAAVQCLPPAYREVVVLCELQEMDYAGAADLIQCPIGTVRSRLNRARALLTSKLGGCRPGSSIQAGSRGPALQREGL